MFTDAQQHLQSNALDALEIGCGTGFNTFSYLFPEHFRKFNGIRSYLAVDYAKPRIAYAKWMMNNLQNFGFEEEESTPIRAEFVHSNLNDLTPEFLAEKRPHSPNQFDVIIANDVLHYSPSISLGIKRLSRLIKDDGVVQIGLYSGEGLKTIRSFQIFLTNKLLPMNSKPLFWFSEDRAQTQLLRYPTSYELRLARKYLLEEFEVTEPNLVFRITPLDKFFELVFYPYITSVSNWSAFSELVNKHGFNILRILPSCDKDSTMVSDNKTFEDKMKGFEDLEQFEHFLKDSGERDLRTGLYKVHLLKGPVEMALAHDEEDIPPEAVEELRELLFADQLDGNHPFL